MSKSRVKRDGTVWCRQCNVTIGSVAQAPSGEDHFHSGKWLAWIPGFDPDADEAEFVELTRWEAVSDLEHVHTCEVPNGIGGEMKWEPRDMLRRLEALVARVPAPDTSGGRSLSTSLLCAYAHDAQALLTVTSSVLRALNAPAPHPEYGDDGNRDVRREEAHRALCRGEAWADRPAAEGWDTSGAGRL